MCHSGISEEMCTASLLAGLLEKFRISSEDSLSHLVFIDTSFRLLQIFPVKGNRTKQFKLSVKEECKDQALE